MKHYVFKGSKPIIRWHFGYGLFTRNEPVVRSQIEHAEWRTIGEDRTSHEYKTGDLIVFEGKPRKITGIARELETGHYIVYTDYTFEVEEDTESKRLAEAEQKAYEDGRRRAESECKCADECSQNIQSPIQKRSFWRRGIV